MDSEQPERRIQTICLIILSTAVIAQALWLLRSVMIPFVLATFCAFGLSPLITFQRRYLWVPRPLAVLATLILGCAILVLIGGVISTSLSQLAANTDLYQRRINQLLDQAMTLLEDYGFDPVNTFNSLSALPLDRVSGLLTGTTRAIVDLLSQGSLILLFLVFLLIGGTARPRPSSGVLGQVEGRIKRYIITKTMVSAATGGLVGFVLAMLGVDLALVFGLFAFLLNFIPSIGSLIATLLPLPVVLMSPESSLTTIILAMALPATIQLVMGNIIEPKILGESLDLHPVTILLALMVWGTLWGIIGMLLAVPLTAVMKILFERLEPTAPIAELLAGRLDRLQSD
ncbi:putative transport protein YhhT [Candidatus Entotheonellaceae bacterium PAL068K]